jgi:two-component system response regulator YesN
MPLENISEWEAWSENGFDKIYDLFARQRAGNFPLPLVKAIAYIQERYTEQIQLTDTAEAAQVSTAYLSRLFSEHLRINFIDFITELRVEKAEKLIRETRMTIKEISYAVGYQDPNYFSKLFRKMTGLPPTVYAAENRLKEEEL